MDLDVYMSFWSNGYFAYKNKQELEETISLYKISFKLAKKFFPRIHLVTDKNGEKLLKDINYTSVDTSLENLPKHISILWSLGKIMTYKIAADQGKPFMHMDGDVFLMKELPDSLFKNCDIFCQHKEFRAFNHYKVLQFFNTIPNKEHFADRLPEDAFNMGIFGGSNLKFIKKYAESALKIGLDEKNINNIRNTYFEYPFIPACCIEQYYLSILVELNNIKVNCLIDMPKEHDPDKYEYKEFLARNSNKLGYFHFWQGKYTKDKKLFLDKIKKYSEYL
jgi:hypothetical protein